MLHKKKLLWITYTLPHFPGSGAPTRQFFLIKEASKYLDIFLVSTARESEMGLAKHIKPFCRDFKLEINEDKSRAWNALRPHINEICKNHAPDFIILDQSEIAHWINRLPTQTCPVGINAHNVNSILWSRIASAESNPFKKLLFTLKSLKNHIHDQIYLSKARAVFTCSDYDTNHFKNINSGINAITIPNGVDTNYFAAQNDSIDYHQVVFVGSLVYKPNSDACRWFAQKPLPELKRTDPRFVFNIIGYQPQKDLLRLQSEHVRIFSDVPDTRPFLQKAAFFVVPLFSGSGTRLKILEAMAMEKVVITTSLGAEGLNGLAHMENIVFANSSQEFVSLITKLQRNPDLARAIGRNARILVKNRYEWHDIGTQFASAIQNYL